MKYLALSLVFATLAIGPSSLSPCAQAAVSGETSRCCKVCRAGKACGDSCIARSKTCHQPRGCACDG